MKKTISKLWSKLITKCLIDHVVTFMHLLEWFILMQLSKFLYKTHLMIKNKMKWKNTCVNTRYKHITITDLVLSRGWSWWLRPLVVSSLLFSEISLCTLALFYLHFIVFMVTIVQQERMIEWKGKSVQCPFPSIEWQNLSRVLKIHYRKINY